MIPIFEPCLLSEAHIADLIHYHRTPERYYHTLHHINEFFEHFMRLYHEGVWTHPTEVYLAILYHDAVYEYGAKDNEEQSALLAQKDIVKYLPHMAIRIDYIMELIRYTANHGSLKKEELSLEAQYFLDCDMAIVGSSTERFLEYEHQVAQEYTQVYLPFLYRMGRKRFLKRLLKADHIFFSDRFHERYDAQARHNIKNALKA